MLKIGKRELKQMIRASLYEAVEETLSELFPRKKRKKRRK